MANSLTAWQTDQTDERCDVEPADLEEWIGLRARHVFDDVIEPLDPLQGRRWDEVT